MERYLVSSVPTFKEWHRGEGGHIHGFKIQILVFHMVKVHALNLSFVVRFPVVPYAQQCDRRRGILQKTRSVLFRAVFPPLVESSKNIFNSIPHKEDGLVSMGEPACVWFYFFNRLPRSAEAQ